MATFRTLHDLEQSVIAAGLDAHLPGIRASVRPIVLLLRVRESDDGLPIGTTKLGGFPSLPPGVPWPLRAAYADAEGRRQRLMNETARARQFTERLAKNEMFNEKQHESFRDGRESRAAWNDARAELGFGPFPLAFVAQFNLDVLSIEPGFPAEFPDTGLLSIFQDVVGGGETRVSWYDQPVEMLTTVRPPQQLADWYDRFTPLGLPTPVNETWQRQTGSDVLHPFSALAVPDHWRYAYPRESPLDAAFNDWLDSTQRGEDPYHLFPSIVGSDSELSTNFGDRLGGWPESIHSPPEPDLAAQRQSGDRTVVPGQTEWFHLFSYADEYYAGTRFMPRAHCGDGTSYILIRDTDLAARRFERAGRDYQRD